MRRSLPLQRQRKIECTTLTQFALHPHTPPLLHDDLACNIESQPKALDMLIAVVAYTIEPVKNMRLILFADASTLILHPNDYLLLLALHANHYGFVSQTILDGVANQVVQNLFQPRFIPVSSDGSLGRFEFQRMIRSIGILLNHPVGHRDNIDVLSNL